ncbi:tetratricopeptide repeat protein [Limnospira platensis CENA597]
MNTIYCLNPGCLHPNPSHFQYCHRCGNRLILKERYIPRSILGQGSFCRTFLANDTDKPSQPFCVIKQFLPQAQGTDTIENASQLFAQEAERLEELGKHSQIPDLIAYFIVNNRQYLIQEFVNGDTLKEELDQNGTFSEPQIREILLEVLEILDFVHSKQVIHRDINPENMIISTVDNKLFIVDFGSAKVVKKPHINVDGTIIGSAEYCAPEQSLGKPLLVSDLYGLGVTCMHLLTGVSPFDLYDTINNRWIWRDYLNGKVVSEELGNIIDKLAHQMPKHRYQSAQEVINALNPSVLEIVTPKPPPVSTQLSVNNETISNIYDHPIPVNFAIASSEPTLPKINFSGESKLVPESSPQIAQKQKASTAISPWKSFWQNAGLVICLVGIAVVGVNTFRDNSTTEPTARSDTSSQYNRPLEIDINDATVYYSRGLTHRRQGNYEAAIADYNRAIEINPNYALAYNGRGLTHRRQGNYEAAIADYNRAIEINPNYHNAYNNRGFAHRSQGNYEAAIADYNRAIEINPNYALAYNGRGITHRSQGNYEAAIADYNRAIEINPNYHNAYNNRGFAHRSQGNYEAAIADYNRAIEINPNYALAYKNRGDAYKVLGEKQKAGSDWQTAANLYRKQDNNAGYQGAMNSLRSLQ